jgi:hypothetical protein
MSDSTNVKLRVPLGRALRYDEIDTNFQEVINVIDEFTQNVSDQSGTNDDFQDQINTKVDQTVYDNHVQSQSDINVDFQSQIDTDIQNQINNKVEDVDGVADNLTIEQNLYLADTASASTDLDGVVVSVDTGVVNISQNSSETAAIELQVDGAKVWTNANDGYGSGLDADLLGGVSSSDYVTEAPETGVQFARIDGGWSEVSTTETNWGAIQGTLTDQTDLEDRLVSIENIKFNITTTSINKTLQHTERCFVLLETKIVSLPLNPSVGDYCSIGVLDFDDTVIDRNGELIMGVAENLTINKKNTSVTLAYVSSGQGWRIIE